MGDKKAVVACRQDHRHPNASQRGPADRPQKRLVRYEIGRRDNHLIARRGQQHGKKVRHRAAVDIGAGADRDGRKAAGHLSCRFVQQRRDILARVGHPVDREEVLELAHDRPLKAHHDVHPGREALLDAELGVGAVLAADIADPPVDHRDLAVIAQIDPRKEDVDRQPERLERDRRLHLRLAQAAPPRRGGKAARTETVDQKPAGNTAFRRAPDRVENPPAVPVRKPDVEQQMDVARRRIDIGDQRIYGGILVRRDRRRVAAQGQESVHRAGPAKRLVELVRHGFRRRAGRGRAIQQLRGRPHPPRDTSADAGLAEKEIEHHPDDRKRGDQKQPRGARGRLPPRSGQRPHRGDDLQDRVD